MSDPWIREMKLTRILFTTVSILVLAFSDAHGAAPFDKDTRLVFIGDSITHGGSYHTYIQTFYATRYPHQNILCFNAGISGDNARGGFQRASQTGGGIWESDIRGYRPTAVTIMFGMNDVGGAHFETAESADALDEANKQQLVWYKSNYAQLLDNLETLGVTNITLITPSAYDQTMVNEQASTNLYKFGTGKNDAILSLADKVIAIESKKRGYPIIDFNTPLLAINAKMQKLDPGYSIIGQDRVHPGLQGHMVMAYSFLEAQGQACPIAKLQFDAATQTVLSTENCIASDVKSNPESLQFRYTANALPYPPKLYQSVSDLIPFESRYNQETLQVNNLNSGTYSLSIGGTACGHFTDQEFAAGINMALLENAPQVQQAQHVFKLCQERAALAGKIRTVVWAVGYLSKIKGHNANDFEANQAMIARLDTGEKPEGLWAPASDHVKEQLQQYLKHAHQYQEMLQNLESLSAPLYTAALPQARTIKVTKVD
ncbi:MAG: SGNH/GDSL hydrolase family protein [Verrucomicrobiota bacterium]